MTTDDSSQMTDEELDELRSAVAALIQRAGGLGEGVSAASDDEVDEDDAGPSSHVSTAAGAESPARILPLEEPSEDLEKRILAATGLTEEGPSWGARFMRGLAWAGSHAMRPQLAMAALFVLVVGSSLLLVRAKPGTGMTPVRVSERGVPGMDAPADAPPPPGALAAAEPEADSATAARGRAGAEERLMLEDAELQEEAKSDKAAKEGEGKDSGAVAALADARAVRDGSGCKAAVAKYDAVGMAYPGTQEASLAMLEAANCYQQMGDEMKARELWLAVRSDDEFKDQADAQLAATEANQMNNIGGASAPGAGAGSGGVAAAKKKASAPKMAPPAPAPAKPAAPGTGNPDAPAAADEAFEHGF